MSLASPSRQRGQGAVEFVIVFVLFAALFMGLFEMTRVFRVKHVLNTATFSAARAGVLNNALKGPMNAELASAMAPIYARENSISGFAAAVARARAFGIALDAAGGGVEIVSPTAAVFDQLARTQYLPADGAGSIQEVTVIPNDNLRWRPPEVAVIDADGQAVAVNLQDANLLKIRAIWCHRLVVPALDRLIFEIVDGFAGALRNARQGVCSRLSLGGQLVDELTGAGLAGGYYIAVSADAVVRMQSPVLGDDLP